MPGGRSGHQRASFGSSAVIGGTLAWASLEGQQLPGDARRHRRPSCSIRPDAYRRLVSTWWPSTRRRESTPTACCPFTAYAQAYTSNPPITRCRWKQAYSGPIDQQRIDDAQGAERHGVRAKIDEHVVLVGNDKLMMSRCGVGCHEVRADRHHPARVALTANFISGISSSPTRRFRRELRAATALACGREETVMLTGDEAPDGSRRGEGAGIDEFHAQPASQDKVARSGEAAGGRRTRGGSRKGQARVQWANGASTTRPVLTRADIGIAMGAMARTRPSRLADVVLMDDKAVQHRPRYRYRPRDHGHRVAEHRVRPRHQVSRAGPGGRGHRQQYGWRCSQT